MIATSKKPILVAASAAIFVALLGGLASMPGPWYDSLAKSDLTPPDWVFGPAWTLIYASCVVASVMAWNRAKTSIDRAQIITLFFFNAVFNVLWSFLFFTIKRPDLALAEVFVLWISVAALILFLRKKSPSAAYLLVPYLLWVSFAAYLNYRVFVLNGPFA